MSNKPTIVLVPGCWLPATIYSGTVESLSQHGYSTVGLPLPSTGAVPPHADFSGDVDSIRSCLVRLVEDEEHEVVLVVHSYAGMPGAEAPKGLGRVERERKGLRGGVIRIVFIMAYVVPEGFSPTDGGAQMPEWMQLNLKEGVATVTPEAAKKIFFNDLSPDEADMWASRLMPQSLGVYSSKTTYAAWLDIPSSFVIGEQDKSFFQPEVVNMMIKTVRQVAPTALDVIEKCNGGHCLMISHADWLAGVLRRAAGEAI